MIVFYDFAWCVDIYEQSSYKTIHFMEKLKARIGV